MKIRIKKPRAKAHEITVARRNDIDTAVVFLRKLSKREFKMAIRAAKHYRLADVLMEGGENE